jgi:hypothetical protein
MSGPNSNNKKGMFENSAIRNNVVKPYLRESNCDPLGQYPLPAIKNLSIPRNFREQVIANMHAQGYTDGPWFYKGAKMCLMWPVWSYAFPDAKWVVVRRRTGDIIQSCMETSFMRAFQMECKQKAVGATNEREGWLWWVHQHEDRFREMINFGLNVKVVYPERMVMGDYRQMMELIEWLGLKWDSKVLEFVDPKLWKARQREKAYAVRGARATEA